MAGPNTQTILLVVLIDIPSVDHKLETELVFLKSLWGLGTEEE
jgi:hypothetical protein